MKLLFIILTIIAVAIATVFLFLTFFPTQKKPTVKRETITGNLYTATTNSSESKKCTWEDTNSGVVTKGTLYASGKNFRATTQTIAGDIAMNNYYLGNGKEVYAWSDLSPESGSILDYASFKSPKKGSIFDIKSNYNCISWTEETGVFTLPSTIKFQ